MEYLFVWYVWLALALLTLILEILLPGFVIACFSVGAAVAAIVAAFGAGGNAQLIVRRSDARCFRFHTAFCSQIFDAQS